MRKNNITVLCIVFLIAFFFALQPSTAIATSSPASENNHRLSLPHDDPDPCLPLPSDGNFFDFIPRTVDSPPSLAEFSATVVNADPNTIAGVFVCRVLALKIIQQPTNDLVYVSAEMNTATQFRLAANYGTLGLLAHNDRSGERFFRLAIGQEVDVVYGDGAIHRYVVSGIRHLQPLYPDDPYSSFLDLDIGGDLVSSTQVFQQFFAGGDRVVFQTCITANGNPTWGRLFVIAMPMSPN